MKPVLVTGAAGYIGGQVALQLRDAGQTVIGIDRTPLPDHLTEVYDQFLCQDFASDAALNWIFSYQPTAIIHCAGASLVAPSMTKPSEYYQNNFVKTKHFLDWLLHTLPKSRFIFSSSAAVYGEPVLTPCHEVDPADPISPYGQSKLMTEWLLASYQQAYGLDYVAFRYFNACGADPECRHGQAPGATHIVARVLESIRDQEQFMLFGDGYPTADGTCVRDYVHVADIANAHVLALSHLIPSGVYNLGSNTGTSNHDIIEAAKRVTGRDVDVVVGKPRPGDPAILTASADLFSALVDWRTHTLDDMIQHAWAWYVRKN